jgi:ABC-type sugar transport system permease subunit
METRDTLPPPSPEALAHSARVVEHVRRELAADGGWAGLGSIPGELYEAAAIDGAGRWQQFRNVTLPLLSPTIYFLVLWTTIGTFKAFNHIYVMRPAAALGTTDTASVVIFQAFKRDTRYGYASALAILLLVIILILTAINNRIASRRVFYG